MDSTYLSGNLYSVIPIKYSNASMTLAVDLWPSDCNFLKKMSMKDESLYDMRQNWSLLDRA